MKKFNSIMPSVLAATGLLGLSSAAHAQEAMGIDAKVN